MTANPTYPGIYIEEPPSPTKTITGVSTSITAFIGLAKKGPPNTPTLIHSYSEYQRKFGGQWKPSHMSYSVHHYFLNRGEEALITRVTDQAREGEFTATGQDLRFRASSPGTWCKDITIETDTDDLGSADNFNVTVLLTENGDRHPVEKFYDLSPEKGNERYAADAINNQSEYIKIPENTSFASPQKAEFNYEEGTAKDDETLTKSMLIDADPEKGINALDEADIFNLLCIPTYTMSEEDLKTVYEYAADYCEKRRAMLLMDPPHTWDKPDSPITNGLGIYNDNAAIYYPRFIANDPLDNKPVEYAPSGAIAGAFARTDATRGIWRAPAGTGTNLSGLVNLKLNLTDEENGNLNTKGVNCLRTFPNVGTVIWGVRTTNGADENASQWKYIPVRRMALHLEESLHRGTRWAVFEPNDEPLWAQLRLNIGSFMHELFRQGAFQGSKPSDAYLVKCDRETTTPTDVAKGIVNIIVGFAPLKPAEFVIIKIQQHAGQE